MLTKQKSPQIAYIFNYIRIFMQWKQLGDTVKVETWVGAHDEDSREFPKLTDLKSATVAKYVRTCLTPRCPGVDIEQHVNNVKYIGWILEKSAMNCLPPLYQHGICCKPRHLCNIKAGIVITKEMWLTYM
ncbi:hypothetical protein GUJ93_ZPchr0007g3729 [Zizania palustris]|uniref:Acyl-ACP thioesterase-like C-terminal domain-containing protein n=1 Tax=Zizania palustris TaxID=103762 RepID=A0A8J5TEA4_ZIZPA|nr:hypothetical protein GUJ93_ZPchr0007g3729 [Zizania palustris]